MKASENTNLPQSRANPTTKFFNGYFEQEIVIGADKLSVIRAYLEQQTSPEAAESLTHAVISAAFLRGLDPLDLLDEIRQAGRENFTAFMALVFNDTRANTSLLGINAAPARNKYVERALLF
jgi:hypothetical protein